MKPYYTDVKADASMFANIITMTSNQAKAVVKPKNFSEWLQRELESRDWTQADLARALPASTGAVSNWLSGARIPASETIIKIAGRLNADVDYLLTIAGHRPADPYYDPESPEAKLLPYIRAVDWSKHEAELKMIMRQLEFIVEVDRGDHDRK